MSFLKSFTVECNGSRCGVRETIWARDSADANKRLQDIDWFVHQDPAGSQYARHWCAMCHLRMKTPIMKNPPKIVVISGP